ncbi:16086_t:CDS:2 [Acaulospora colombiana]|uniref:16086_t:CDS:1 n=1 Tax=Acaulospora colombiana TaxID=27376 RepID=A0ACA9L227_9GLOM|nr:16086_t:CDS:2 [Acaulospora colombiana]
MIQVNDAQTEFLGSFDISEDPNHTGLSNTFIDSNFKKIVLHPKEIPPEDQEEMIATLLRTKPIPEIAQREKQIKQEIAIEEGLDDLERDARKDMNDETKWERLQKEWQSRYNEHKELVRTASAFCEDTIEKMEIKFRIEPEEDVKIKKEDTGTRANLTLENVLEFMSSGFQNGKGPVAS